MGLLWELVSALIKTIFSKDPSVDQRQARPSSRQPLPYVPSIAAQRRAESGGMELADKERMWQQWQWTGHATLCCNRPICECGQNWRWINGAAQRLPGVVLPGSSAAEIWEGIEDARRRLESGETKVWSARKQIAADIANETTGPIPRVQ